jgi:GAF domain-containing protein
MLNTDVTDRTESLKREVDALAGAAQSSQGLMSAMVKLLRARIPAYNWVGFYLIDKSGPEPMLILGPYEGAPTPHTRIPLNQGICGAAASSGETVVVDDVGSDPRYLACSIETKSEIVVPICVRGEVVGEVDIDSHTPAAFTGTDRKLVEYCARVVGKHMERHSG